MKIFIFPKILLMVLFLTVPVLVKSQEHGGFEEVFLGLDDISVQTFISQGVLFVDMERRSCVELDNFPASLWGNRSQPERVVIKASQNKEHLTILGFFQGEGIQYHFSVRGIQCDTALEAHAQALTEPTTESSQTRRWFVQDLNGVSCVESSPPANRIERLAESGYRPVVREPEQNLVEVGYYAGEMFYYWTFFSSKEVCLSRLANQFVIPERLR